MAATPSIHPAVKAYAERHRIDGGAVRSDGRLTLSVDGRYRLHLRTLVDNRIAVTARLLDLSGRSNTDDLLGRLGSIGAGMLRDHASTLCLDERDQALLLQEVLVPATDAAQLESAIAGFLNALGFWSRICASESSLPAH